VRSPITPADAYFRFRLLARLAEHAERARQAPPAGRKPGPYDALRESKRKGLAEGKDDGRIKRFLSHVRKKENFPREVHCIMNLCMAATYDPDPKAPLGFRVPFNLESGETIRGALKKWRGHDPINLVARYATT